MEEDTQSPPLAYTYAYTEMYTDTFLVGHGAYTHLTQAPRK